MKQNLAFVDAETDGLYGKFLSVAFIVVDNNGNELERAYYGIKKENLFVTDEWTKEHVLPILGAYEECDNQKELLEKVWNFWKKYSNTSYAIADVPFPVECRLFEACVRENLEERCFQGPFPLLDLSSMLFALGKDPNITRKELLISKEEKKNELCHNALYDVEMSIKIWNELRRK